MNGYSEGFEGNKIYIQIKCYYQFIEFDNKKKFMQKLKGWDFIFVRIEGFLIVLFWGDWQG